VLGHLSQPGRAEDATGDQCGWQLLLPHAYHVWRSSQLQQPALFHEKQTIVNGDYLMNQKNTLAMRFMYNNDPRVASFNTPIGGALPGAPTNSLYSNANAVLKLTTIITNSLVNEARGSFQRLFASANDSLPAGWTPRT